MSGTKRKQLSVSMEVKFDALKRIDSGENVGKIVSGLNVGRSTVLGWKNERSEIESWCLKRVCTQSKSQRKTMQCADYEKVSESLYEWFGFKGTTVRVTAVDIDPMILDVAKKHFGFQEDTQLKVVIEDGLDYLKNAVKTGTKFNAILFDVDSKDSSLGLSCPPTSFLEPEILSATADCLTDTGVFVMNFVCRVENLRQQTITKMEALFGDISSIKLKQEVNEIFYCWKSKKKMAIEKAVDKLNNAVKNKKVQKLDIIDKKEILSMIRVK